MSPPFGDEAKAVLLEMLGPRHLLYPQQRLACQTVLSLYLFCPSLVASYHPASRAGPGSAGDRERVGCSVTQHAQFFSDSSRVKRHRALAARVRFT